ncbi:hypothetical protein HALLA_20120 (plasmid) [Halostagnicola larsenii XH-48]|uniref:DUF4013 domain-containing protein n=1 Tax=Halostagnicola larsenii XH-48 TaxID=797299 RepID=W0JUG4_9EURY|nr:DUF4013 domain-containing protein [Halostagnicola larsenii]AHG02209.1 hypothetical protein HALLA_20120 [Halostagnicola larsenii XH-48]
MLIDALRYPTRGADSLTVAGIVVAVAVGYRYTAEFVPSIVAVVPGTVTMAGIVLLVGYLSQVLIDDSQSPPPIDVRSALGAGIKSLGIAIGYLVVPTVVMVTTVLSFVETGGDASNGVPAVFLISSTAALFFFLTSAYALPAALAAATTDGVRAAIDREQVFPALGELSYATGLITGFTLFGIGLIPITTTLGSGDIAGLLSALFGAYLLLVGSRVIHTGYRRATTSK